MLHMALSNTVKPYYDDGELKFQAESAEELAMVLFARRCGFVKTSQNPTVVKIIPYDVTGTTPKALPDEEQVCVRVCACFVFFFGGG